MIDITIFELEVAGWPCDNPKCKNLPEYTVNIIGNNFHIKKGTIAGKIALNHATFDIYCRDCIDVVYQEIKFKMDSKLWAVQ
jgi:hypothetical protein